MITQDAPLDFKDVRFMTLKRWNLPQTKQIFGPNYNGNTKRGEYISFCTHHFLDIQKAKPDANKKTSLSDAYKLLSERRKKASNPKLDIHTVQSMTLVGPETNFWATPAEVLYVTFIQLAAPDIEQFGAVQEKIKDTLTAYSSPFPNSTPEFALYYSYDFCDLVLYTKNIKFNDLHNALWQFTLIRTGVFSNIRDTFTLCSFGWDFLKNSFHYFNNTPQKTDTVIWNDTLSISVNLSISNICIWNNLQSKLAEVPGKKDHRLPGRNDINFTAEDIPGTTVLKIFYELDKLCGTNQAETLSGYEVILQAAAWSEDTPSDNREFKKKIRKKETLNSVVKPLLADLCSKYPPDFPAVTDYLFETRRSLEELLKNGFADEFVLSVLPSFVAYLKIGLECSDKKHNTNETFKSLDDLRRRYYSALNTLSLCTMHDERQFIQAPSFNASYFEIPPKLLVFFSAVAYDMSEQLHIADAPNKSCGPYRFVIAPDYREDIYVKAPQISGNTDTYEHLAIIKLCERYFYEPQKTIMLLAHEIGHFVGDRKRKERARLIFKSICLHLLSMVPLSSILTKANPSISDLDMLGLFSDVLANYLVEDAEKRIAPTRGIPFLLEDISDYIEEIDYGMALFFKDSTREEIEEKWRKALVQKLQSADGDYYREQLTRGLLLIQENINSQHLTNAIKTCSTDSIPESIIEIYTRSIVTNLCNLQFESKTRFHNQKHSDKSTECYNDPITAFVQNCEHVITAFSESYADFRLYQLCGQSFSFGDYESLLSEINSQSSYEHEVRRKVIRQVFCHEAESCAAVFEKDDHYSYEEMEYPMSTVLNNTTIEYIVSYLEQFKEIECKSTLAEEALAVFKTDNLFEQCQTIDKTISYYRDKLTKFCRAAIDQPKKNCPPKRSKTAKSQSHK